MTIQGTQIDLVRNDIAMAKMKEGFYPSVSLIETLVSDAFKLRAAGLPRFVFKEMKKGQASSSADYNNMFTAIGMDLIVGFEETKRLNNRIMSLAGYYESGRMKINKLLQELELSTKALQVKSDSQGYQTVVGDMINDFKMIDFKGKQARNIPKTNAFVNLIQSDVEMKRQRGGTILHDLSESKIKFQAAKEHTIIHLSPMQSMLADTIHDSWRALVVTKESSVVTTNLTIEVNEPVMASNVIIDMQSGKPAYVTLFLSIDGVDFVRFERQKISSTYQWVFETREIKAIRFEMEKREEDRPNGSEFEYIFGVKNVQLSETLYVEESHFISKPFPLPGHEAIKKVTLESDDYLPPDTSIRYYIGFDYKDNMIEWQEIRKDRPVITDMVKAHSMEVSRYTEGYAQMTFERFGVRYYRIAKLNHKPIPRSIRLMVGRNMWLRETIAAPFIYEPTDDPSDDIVYQTGIFDWLRTVSGKKDYLRIQTGYDYLQSNRFHRYATFIESLEIGSIVMTVQGTADTSHAVFINGTQVKDVDNKYELSLAVGWNKIEVYAYARVLNQEIIMDFYMPTLNNQIFASRTPMRVTSLYDLLNNTTTRNLNRFAVDEDNSLIVNYDPKRMDVQGNLTQDAAGSDQAQSNSLADGVEYALDYEYSVSEETEHEIRLMAILRKEKQQIKVTPRIKGYQLIVE